MDRGKISRWLGMCRCTKRYTGKGGGWSGGEREIVIRFGTYNTRNQINRGLESALRGMNRTKLDLGVFQDTKVMDRIHMRASAGYRILADDVPRWYRGGVAVFYWDAPHFKVEAFLTNGLNVTRFQLASSGRIFFIVRCYIASDKASTVESVVAAIVQRPRGSAPMVAEKFNSDLAAPEGNFHGEEIAL